jgi:hypothetical protein
MPTASDYQVQALDKHIATFEQNVTQIDRDLETNRRNRSADPFAYDREYQRLLHQRGVEMRQLEKLRFERRCALPAGGGDSLRSGSYFLPRGY